MSDQFLVVPKPKSTSKLPYLAALRPRQWTKNLVVFAAPLFSFDLSWQTVVGSLLTFFLFCGLSGAFYLANDIIDLESDRKHPVKCQRPIASGQVRIATAVVISATLLLGTLTISFLRAPALGFTLLAYAVLQILYNLKLKSKPIADTIAIALGFVLRAVAGGAANDIPLSSWFILCTAMLALFLAIEKRKAELHLLAAGIGKTRSVLKRYSLPLLVRMEGNATSGAIISYALWSAGPVVGGASTPWMMLTLPFVIYGIFRYQFLSDTASKWISRETESNFDRKTERPEEILLKDRPIRLTVIGWIVSILLILWLEDVGRI